jgi:ubiquitin carboxyl-terminal hydrolase 5/13
MQGLQNLGNSCYLNSVMQLLCTLPEFAHRYGTKPNGNIVDNRLLIGATPTEATNSLIVQTTKLANALTSGVFSLPEEMLESDSPTDPKYRLAPRMLKHVIGKDHIDFRTGQQQDAAQFLQYYLEQLDRAEAKLDKNLRQTSQIFAFQTEERLVCTADQKIKYKAGATETMWSMRIPMDKAVVLPSTGEVEPELKKQKQEEEKPIPSVTFAQCLEAWSTETTVDDYRWPHLQNTVHAAVQTTRFQNFPRYLWVQMQRYELGEDWQPIKLEVNLDIPEEIDLSSFKAGGPQEGEALAPEEETSASVTTKPELNEGAIYQLMDMGFSMNGCKRALTAVGGSDAEAAMNWIFEHNSDPDFNDPLPEDNGAPATSDSSDGGVDDGVVISLVENLGCFTIDQVRAALKETNGAADRAADWLFSHMVGCWFAYGSFSFLVHFDPKG